MIVKKTRRNSSVLICFLIFSTITHTSAAQDSTRIKPLKLTLVEHKKENKLYQPFVFPIGRIIDYSNYPLTADQILRRNAQAGSYDRMYNLITNHNKNGFIGNLLGLQRIQKPHPSPGF